ncbi:type II secretion system F family protein [Syntrophomonas palmitatica]|uniref:type II secretion system F family protein n=1 Tax=Syntrophomonas palmitatica TaxID=402877 RepID=UPI0006D1E367|nr:type II secretion system F family protein [Syntrophomonas palmitatica]
METLLVTGFFLTIASLTMGIIHMVKRDRLTVLDRLDSLERDERSNQLPPELQLPLMQRIQSFVKPVFRNISQRLPRQKNQVYENKLMAAGYPHGMDASSFVLLKYLSVAVFAVMGLISHNVTCFVVLVFIGYAGPDIYLKMQEGKRKESMLKSLPDILDLLSVSVEAGLSFDGALQKVVEKSEGPLTLEFEKTLKEINLGTIRREALRSMAERVNVDDIRSFLGSVIQADQMGVSMSNVLRIQSNQVRNNRRMRVEEQAQKAPVKILLPLVLFIFPTILIVLLGPAMIQIIDSL